MRHTLAASRPRTQPSCLNLTQGQRAGARSGLEGLRPCVFPRIGPTHKYRPLPG